MSGICMACWNLLFYHLKRFLIFVIHVICLYPSFFLVINLYLNDNTFVFFYTLNVSSCFYVSIQIQIIDFY